MSAKINLSGLRSIEECLRASPQKILKILLPAGKLSPRVEQIKQQAQKKGIRIENNSKMDGEEGVLALLNDFQYFDFDQLCNDLQEELSSGEQPSVLALDGVTDPQNLGAILRTAAFMGISAVILPKDRAATINDTAYRVASGGIEYLRIAQVSNLVYALKSLKEIGFWVVGLSEHATENLFKLKRDFSPVLVIGNEEKGIRPLVSENCDYLVSLEAKGKLKSLNASVAAALAMSWTL